MHPLLVKDLDDLSKVCGREIIQSTKVSGGDTALAYKLILADGTRVFCKQDHLNAFTQFSAESTGLEILNASNQVNQAGWIIPQVIWCGVTDHAAYLLLDWVDLHKVSNFENVGKGLARIHRMQSTHFGWDRDNYLGHTKQNNHWATRWDEFYWSQRLLPLVTALEQKGMIRVNRQRLQDTTYQLLQHMPTPSLIHGDLWIGNIGESNDGTVVLFDPATYYADRELDFAMTRLFGQFPQEFYTAYQEEWPLPNGYQDRQKLYELYHILNHAVLFGEYYLSQVKLLLKKLGI